MKTLSYIMALTIGLMAVAPPIPYTIPLVINSFWWLYAVIAVALCGFFLLTLELNHFLKALIVYMFGTCFISQAPSFSFNTYMLIVATAYFFIIVQRCDFNIILKAVQAIFWLEVVICFVQFFGKDRLMGFDTQERVFFGTVFQEMRLGSLFAILSPFLLLKSRWYIIPIFLLTLYSSSLGFSLAVASAAAYYVIAEYRHTRVFRAYWKPGVVILACLVTFYCWKSWSHIYVEIVEGRLPVWWVIVKSWALDTTKPMGQPDIFGISQTGPFCAQTFFFGHGLDTFIKLFPYYKHDPNPFPNAHNDFLQILWELGLTGFLIFIAYCSELVYRLNKVREPLLIAGLILIAFNMTFHFPWRMTQTVLLMVAYVALCEKQISTRFSASF